LITLGDDRVSLVLNVFAYMFLGADKQSQFLQFFLFITSIQRFLSTPYQALRGGDIEGGENPPVPFSQCPFLFLSTPLIILSSPPPSSSPASACMHCGSPKRSMLAGTVVNQERSRMGIVTNNCPKQNTKVTCGLW